MLHLNETFLHIGKAIHQIKSCFFPNIHSSMCSSSYVTLCSTNAAISDYLFEEEKSNVVFF